MPKMAQSLFLIKPPERGLTVPRISQRMPGRLMARPTNVQAAVKLDEPVNLPQQPSEVGRKAGEQVAVGERRAGEGYMFQLH